MQLNLGFAGASEKKLSHVAGNISIKPLISLEVALATRSQSPDPLLALRIFLLPS